jgi:nitroimidazol reductase NimA-like FMN-containing flavoprotein (pyridoxamine 5'-phosphate oxidase superfamily)
MNSAGSFIMNQPQDLGSLARTIIETNIYMVLGTADEVGQAWVSPVYYAHKGYREFYWVSSPDVQHSRNIAVRPQISIVIFDSQAPIGTGQGVYMLATAEVLSGAEQNRGLEIFSRSSLKNGGRKWEQENVTGSALYRLYRATALEHWVRDPSGSPDHRTPVTL